MDDEDAIRGLIRVVLERAGYTVFDACNGEQALEIFRHEGLGIKLLLSDVVMPKLDGLKLADKVLEIRPELPVLFISGNNANVTRGFGCLAKPFTPDLLVGRVSEILTEGDNPPPKRKTT